MDWDRFAGDWSGMGGKIRQQWGKLTEDDISQAGGDRNLVLERIRERYGLGPDEAERQLAEWGSSLGSGPGTANANQSVSTDEPSGEQNDTV